MRYWEVEVERLVTQVAKVRVNAESEEEAHEAAVDEAVGNADWICVDSNGIDVSHCREIEPEEEP